MLLSAKGKPVCTGAIRGVACNLSGVLSQVCGAQVEWKGFHNEDALNFLNTGVSHRKKYVLLDRLSDGETHAER